MSAGSAELDLPVAGGAEEEEQRLGWGGAEHSDDDQGEGSAATQNGCSSEQ